MPLVVAAAFDRGPENFLGRAIGIHIGRVEHIQAGIEANIHQPRGFGDIGRAPGFELFADSAKRASAEAERRNFQPGTAELTKLHEDSFRA